MILLRQGYCVMTRSWFDEYSKIVTLSPICLLSVSLIQEVSLFQIFKSPWTSTAWSRRSRPSWRRSRRCCQLGIRWGLSLNLALTRAPQPQRSCESSVVSQIVVVMVHSESVPVSRAAPSSGSGSGSGSGSSVFVGSGSAWARTGAGAGGGVAHEQNRRGDRAGGVAT